MTATAREASDPRALARASVRARIGQAVFTVFAERGFEETTASEAAEAAGISRASFFRYFNTKEEAVFAAQEAMGVEIAAELASRPTDEETWISLRRCLDAAVRTSERTPAETLARVQLTRRTPGLRAHQLERQLQWRRMVADVLASRLHLEPGGVRAEALAGAALSALDSAVACWADGDGEADLNQLIDQAFACVREFVPK